MKVDVIVGGLYGDEGKGKIVSKLGQNYDYVFRVNASTNASHTVQIGENVYITKQLPSVFSNPNTKFVVCPGAIVNLGALKDEVKSRVDREMIFGKVSVASTVSLLLDPYIEMNKASSYAKNVGSTNQGTGNAVALRCVRASIKLFDIINVINGLCTKRELEEKIKYSCKVLDKDYDSQVSLNYFEKLADKLINDYLEIKDLIGDFAIDYTNFLANLDSDSNILIEGCNGIMLDNLHGLIPYTTGYSTSINALLNGANISPYMLNNVFIIITGYICCLNKRPFVTEMLPTDAEKIYKFNNEIDDAESMQRRVGWLDIPTLRKALIGHKNCKLILNKLDIMEELEKVKVCDYYLDSKNNKIYIMPDNYLEYSKLKPHYIEFPGWGKINGGLINTNLENFISYIEESVGMDIVYLGLGKRDEDLVENKTKVRK